MGIQLLKGSRMSSHRSLRTRFACAALTGILAGSAGAVTTQVPPSVETLPVPSSGDAADDPAIWIHPTNPALSVVLGTDKHAGLAVYDLAGNQLQFLSGGDLNNVDPRVRFPLGGGLVDIATTGNRTNDSISVFSIDQTTGLLTNVAAGSGIPTLITVYGYCMYASTTGKFYGIVNSKDGDVEQYELFDNGSGLVTGTLVRSFAVGGQTEGCVADDEAGVLYIGEEEVGIWRYGAEPGDGTTRTQVDSTGGGGHLTADVEGLAIYYEPGGAGYLIASSQGSNEYVLYERGGTNAYIGTFAVVDGNGIDGTSETDGLDVTNVAMGAAFPAGMFVVQDGVNTGGNQNYKFVKWEDIAQSFVPALSIDTTWNPRPACIDGLDNDGDGRIDALLDPGCTDENDESEVADCGAGTDADDDGTCDDFDVCLGVFDPAQIDTDLDGYGNRCDADYDGNGNVGGGDFITFRGAFGSSLGQPAFDPDVDSDGDDVIGGADFISFRSLFGDPPGPSGLACAGTPPCSP